MARQAHTPSEQPGERRESITRLDHEGARLLAEDAHARFNAISMFVSYMTRTANNRYPDLMTIALAEMASGQSFAAAASGDGQAPQQPTSAAAAAAQQVEDVAAIDPTDNFAFDKDLRHAAAVHVGGRLASVGIGADGRHTSYARPAAAVQGPVAGQDGPALDRAYYDTLGNAAGAPAGAAPANVGTPDNGRYPAFGSQPEAVGPAPIAEGPVAPVTSLQDYRDSQQDQMEAAARDQVRQVIEGSAA